MEEEAEKLKELQNEVEKQMNMSPPPGNAGPVIMSLEEKMEADARSIYVGNVDYGATAEELEAHFHGCGSVNRVTILCDKYSGHPKGFAYIEFSDKESVRTSMALDESLFRGRQIKVIPKRTNRPGISTTDRGFPRTRYRARGGGYSATRARFYSGYSRPRGRGLQEVVGVFQDGLESVGVLQEVVGVLQERIGVAQGGLRGVGVSQKVVGVLQGELRVVGVLQEMVGVLQEMVGVL
ncbi:LOW QUALITY PROTEIN: polyadenylate-binding protein 2-like [Harpia harpyja]|uniref:LOW QUALITY PROTEIN: polyadenylate-binding protein 2-like n=1 Tax=Harpia harpyja TaxID=202280 RepID=UPI0022B15E29|nr:LOW QUALITY PROTEIN: polyadenylate-binding protein 2-like [Harpia harpyja]